MGNELATVKRALQDLLEHVEEDIPKEQCSRHLLDAMQWAAEILKDSRSVETI